MLCSSCSLMVLKSMCWLTGWHTRQRGSTASTTTCHGISQPLQAYDNWCCQGNSHVLYGIMQRCCNGSMLSAYLAEVPL